MIDTFALQQETLMKREYIIVKKMVVLIENG